MKFLEQLLPIADKETWAQHLPEVAGPVLKEVDAINQLRDKCHQQMQVLADTLEVLDMKHKALERRIGRQWTTEEQRQAKEHASKVRQAYAFMDEDRLPINEEITTK